MLEGLEAVRKRPGMYVGSTDERGLLQLVNEIVDNGVDEALAGHATRVEVTLHPDGSVEVADDGRGIPTQTNDKSGMSGVELALTKLHASGKFGQGGYKTSGGLHGVGATAVNALSDRLEATVRRDGKIHEVSFQHGVAGVFTGPGPKAAFTPGAGLRITGKCRLKDTGTTIRYWVDSRFFDPGSKLDAEKIRTKLRNTAFLVAGLTLAFRDARSGDITEETHRYDGGLVDMVEFLSPAGGKSVSGTVHFVGEGGYKETAPDVEGVMRPHDRVARVEVALRWGTGYDTEIRSFTNVVYNQHGGSHRKGFDKSLLKSVNDAMRTAKVLKVKDEAVILDDVLEGVTAVIHVHAPEPQFTSQTKDELRTAGVQKVVTDVVGTHLKAWLEGRKTKAEARVVMEKVSVAAQTRLRDKSSKDLARRKTALEGASMPAKLADCRAPGVERSELYLVEGDSAAGSAKKGRSAEYQAILPLRGKILNVQKTKVSDAFANAEITAIVQVLGCGWGRGFEIEKMRYGRVLIMADADVDGSHIRCLLITLFAKYLRPVIETGRLYAAMPPLHKVTTRGRSSETIYTYTQDEMARTVARLEKAGKQVVTPVPRFKGLGEMDPSELWETTMDPSRRAVRQITMEDVDAAEALLELLMGNRVEPRRDWIIEYADQIDREAIDA